MNKKTLNNNINALKEVCPPMVEWLTSQPLTDWITQIKSENGQPNLLIKQGSKKHPVYNMKDPRTKSREIVKGMELYKENVNVIIGLGLGYLAKAILNRMEKGHKVVVVEPVAHMVLLAFSKFNFSKYIKNGSFILVPGKSEAAGIIGVLDARLVIENWMISISEYASIRIDEYKDLTDYVFQIINQTRCNIGTVSTSGYQIADNDIVSLPYVIRHRGVKELKDLYKGKPAVLVSTGPSLRKNIHELTEVRDKVIIIAVAQALRPLEAYDITPDFICTVDFGEVNMGHLKGIMDSQVPLVALNRTYAPLLREYKGPKFIVATNSHDIDETASNLMNEKGYIDQGGSVAHLCLGLAYHMGCDPIVLMGQDLAYGDNLSHTPLADAAGKVEIDKNGAIQWEVKDQRCSLHEKDKKYSMGNTCKVPGYFGDAVDTNVGLASFITSFEALGKEYGSSRRLINATEGGARIRGIDPMIFQDFVKEYNINNSENIDRSLLIPLRSLADNADELIEKVIPLLKKDIENLQDIQKQCKSGLEDNEEVEKIIELKEKKGDKIIWTEEEKKELIELFKKNKEHSQAAYEGAKKNSLVALAIYYASRAISSRKLNVKRKLNHVFTHIEDMKIRMESNKLILTSAKEASEKLEKSYLKSLDLLEEYDKTKNNELLISSKEEEVNLEDAEEYFKSGNFAHPMLDARKKIKEYIEILNDLEPMDDYYIERDKAYKSFEKEFKQAEEIEVKALDMRNEAIEEAKKIDKVYYSKLLKYNKLIEEGQKTGKETGDFEKALLLLEEAYKLLPEKPEARWGLATTYYNLKRYEESIEMYKQLIKDFPDNLDFQFEYSQLLIVSERVLDGLQVVKRLMEKTDQYDSFLRGMGRLYYKSGMYEESLKAYANYLAKFEADYTVWEDMGECLKKMGKEEEGKEAINKAKQIKTGKRQTDHFNKIFEDIRGK